jgi:O-Antigen ligase
MASVSRRVLPAALPLRRRVAASDLGRVTVALTAGGSVVGLGLANGGYFPVSWGWSAVAFLAVAGAALATGGALRMRRLELLALALLAALTCWEAASIAWSLNVTETVDEVERTIVYVAAAAAVLLLVRGARAYATLVAVWAATAGLAVYGLAIWLFPQHLGFEEATWRYRLSAPVGYWNAFGILCAVGALLALGLAARTRGALRAAAGASIVVLTITLYFTFSRGAWLALAVGFVIAALLDRRRLQLLATACVLAPWPAVAIVAASHSSALTTAQAPLQAVARDGHGMAVIVIGLAAFAAFAMLLLDAVESRVRLPRWMSRAFAAVLAAVVMVAVVGAVVHYGSPATIVRKAYHSFVSSPSPTQSELQSRLFSVSGNGRSAEWHTAWNAVRGHPWLGIGGGSYDVYWFQHRQVAVSVHDAHNLYLETLAELGPVGLLLLLGALAVPVVAFVRARGQTLAAAALAAYVAFLVHATVDWDWEMPVVTLAAFFVGFGLIGLSRAAGTASMPVQQRAVGVLAVLGLGALVVWTLLGNIALSASTAATETGNYPKAVREAKDAATFLPWSSQPWRRMAEAQAAANHLEAARVSLRKAVAKEPKDWTLWFDLAQVSSGEARKAALDEALRLDPMSAEIANWHP